MLSLAMDICETKQLIHINVETDPGKLRVSYCVYPKTSPSRVMSHYQERIDEDKKIEYGFDPVPNPGYFYFIKEYDEGYPRVVDGGDTRKEMATHDNEEQMNRSEIVEVLKDYGVSRDHVEAMAMDQKF